MRRVSSDGVARPVPFVQRAQRVHPATTGVTVLEHMEQIDAAERKLQELAPSPADDVREEAEEVDVGVAVHARPVQMPPHSDSPIHGLVLPRSDPLPVVQEHVRVEVMEPVEPVPEEAEDDDDEMNEQDLAALSKSTSHLEISPSRLHGRWTSAEGVAHTMFDMFGTPGDEHIKPKTVIVEVSKYYCFWPSLRY
jgi:phosphatidylinositol 4-kinase type 2